MLLKIVNSLLLISFVIQLFSTLPLIFHVGGPIGELSYTVHEGNGKIFLILVLWHIYLNRFWIINNIFLQRRRQ